MHKTDELRTQRVASLITPQTLADEYPISLAVAENVTMSRRRIEAILAGDDPRLLVIVGPCSIHDIDAALEYAQKLTVLREKYHHRLEIVMRTYFEKPRTVVGWKGLISDPNLDNSCQVNKGIRLARKLLIDVNQLGIPTATEFLDMVTGQYIADLISWGLLAHVRLKAKFTEKWPLRSLVLWALKMEPMAIHALRLMQSVLHVPGICFCPRIRPDK